MSDKIRTLRDAGHEKAFQSWYATWSKRADLDPNPDAPEHHYDYRAAYMSGETPDADMHWPSQHKGDNHPNLIINGINTKTGKKK